MTEKQYPELAARSRRRNQRQSQPLCLSYQASPLPTPQTCWTCLLTLMNPPTVCVTRCHMEKWLPVIRWIVPSNGFTLHVLALPRSQKENGIVQSAPLKEKRSRLPYHSIFIHRNIFVVTLVFVLWKCFWEEWISGKPKIKDLLVYEAHRSNDIHGSSAWWNLVFYSIDMSLKGSLESKNDVYCCCLGGESSVFSGNIHF